MQEHQSQNKEKIMAQPVVDVSALATVACEAAPNMLSFVLFLYPFCVNIVFVKMYPGADDPTIAVAAVGLGNCIMNMAGVWVAHGVIS